MQQAHQIYLTRFQPRMLHKRKKKENEITGRRTGKTDGLVAPRVWAVSNSMPGMLGA